MKGVAGTSQPALQLVVVNLGTTLTRDFAIGKENIVAQICCTRTGSDFSPCRAD